jgi:hypothetical protein
MSQSSDYNSALKTSQARYQSMVDELNAAKTTASADIASEYGEVASMYASGGSYGAGQRAELEDTLGKGVAQEQANLVATGMSSGSMAAGTRSKYAKNLATGYKNIEDTRTDKYASALTAVAAAKESRGSRLTSAYQTSAQLIQGFKDPTVSEYANEEKISKAKNTASLQATAMTQSAETARNNASIEAAQKLAETKYASGSTYI